MSNGSKLLATVHLDDGVAVTPHASTLDSGKVVASVAVRGPETFESIICIYSSNLDALDELANALHQAANLGRVEAAKKTPAQAEAPVSSPEADVPPSSAPGEPQAVAR